MSRWKLEFVAEFQGGPSGCVVRETVDLTDWHDESDLDEMNDDDLEKCAKDAFDGWFHDQCNGGFSWI